MCYAGSANETAKQLKELLNLEEFENNEIFLSTVQAYLTKLNTQVKSENVSLNTANRLYPRIGFNLNKSYVDLVKNNFHSEVEQLDYTDSAKSSKKINDWVAEQTKDKIKDLIPQSSITNDTQLILVNAIYFKGTWMHQFEKVNIINILEKLK